MIKNKYQEGYNIVMYCIFHLQGKDQCCQVDSSRVPRRAGLLLGFDTCRWPAASLSFCPANGAGTQICIKSLLFLDGEPAFIFIM